MTRRQRDAFKSCNTSHAGAPNCPIGRSLLLGHSGAVAEPLSTEERRALARLLFAPGVVGCLVGAAGLAWAYSRSVHDNERNWAVLTGWAALIGGELLLLVAAVLRPWRTEPLLGRPADRPPDRAIFVLHGPQPRREDLDAWRVNTGSASGVAP